MRLAVFVILSCLIVPATASADKVGATAEASLGFKIPLHKKPGGPYVGAGLIHAESRAEPDSDRVGYTRAYVGFGLRRRELTVDLALGVARSSASPDDGSQFYESWRFVLGGDASRFRADASLVLARAGALQYGGVVVGYHDLDVRVCGTTGFRCRLGLHAEHYDWKLRAGPGFSSTFGSSSVVRFSLAYMLPVAGDLPAHGVRFAISVSFE